MLFPRLLKFSTCRSLGAYLKHVDILFDSNVESYNEPFAEIIESLQDNQFFLKNGKKTVVKYIAEKMLQAPSTLETSRFKDYRAQGKVPLDKQKEVKVSVNRLALGDLVCEDHYNLQLSLSRSIEEGGDQDSNFNSLNTDIEAHPVNFQIKYDLRNDAYFMAEAQNAIENLEADVVDFRALDDKLEHQIADLITSRHIEAELEQVKEAKIDYAEGIRIKKLAKSANNVVYFGNRRSNSRTKRFLWILLSKMKKIRNRLTKKMKTSTHYSVQLAKTA